MSSGVGHASSSSSSLDSSSLGSSGSKDPASPTSKGLASSHMTLSSLEQSRPQDRSPGPALVSLAPKGQREEQLKQEKTEVVKAVVQAPVLTSIPPSFIGASQTTPLPLHSTLSKRIQHLVAPLREQLLAAPRIQQIADDANLVWSFTHYFAAYKLAAQGGDLSFFEREECPALQKDLEQDQNFMQWYRDLRDNRLNDLNTVATLTACAAKLRERMTEVETIVTLVKDLELVHYCDFSESPALQKKITGRSTMAQKAAAKRRTIADSPNVCADHQGYMSLMKFLTLPLEIIPLQKAERLFLVSKGLLFLSPAIDQLTHMKELYIDSNFLVSLPPTIGKLTCLTTLSVRHNSLFSLPSEISELVNLKELYLQHNKLNSFPPIENMEKLEYLTFDSNLEHFLPSDIERRKDGTTITMEGDAIAKMRAHLRQQKEQLSSSSSSSSVPEDTSLGEGEAPSWAAPQPAAPAPKKRKADAEAFGHGKTPKEGTL